MLESLTTRLLAQIRVIAQWLQKLDPQSDGAARDWVAIYDECSRILYEEIDYRLEGANADRFRWGTNAHGDCPHSLRRLRLSQAANEAS